MGSTNDVGFDAAFGGGESSSSSPLALIGHRLLRHGLRHLRRNASAAVLDEETLPDPDEEERHFALFTGTFSELESIGDLYNIIMAIVCVTCAGLASGLTIGLMSLDSTKLEIKALTGEPREVDAVITILPVLRNRHLLLVTLMLFNALANEALPIFLGALVPAYLAVIISVTFVLIFGEILPTAFFTGNNSLILAAKMVPLVYTIITILYPIAFPISRALDYLFGESGAAEESGISRAELEALMVLQNREHRETFGKSITEGKPIDLAHAVSTGECVDVAQPSPPPTHSGLSMQEVALMTGVMRLSDSRAADAMTMIDDVFMISSSTRLDQNCLDDIRRAGFSRIPVHTSTDRRCVRGYLLTKMLIGLSPTTSQTVGQLSLSVPHIVGDDWELLRLLALFQGGNHLALVCSGGADMISSAAERLKQGRPLDGAVEVVGIITLEDVLERIIQDEILDETDAKPKPGSFVRRNSKIANFEAPLTQHSNQFDFSQYTRPKSHTIATGASTGLALAAAAANAISPRPRDTTAVPSSERDPLLGPTGVRGRAYSGGIRNDVMDSKNN